MEKSIVVLPGDEVDSAYQPTAQKRRIGKGIKQDVKSNLYTSTVAGRIDTDFRKKSVGISTPRARYFPRVGDSVIAQVRSGGQEMYSLYINAFSQQAILPQLAFEGASKKTRPMLKNGDLVYARIIFAQKNMDIEMTCVNPSTGKADGLGPLNDGMVFEVSPEFADMLLKKQLSNMLDELASKVPGGFEIVIGNNGKVWVDCAEAGAVGTIAVGRILQQADEGLLNEMEQKKLVNRIVRGLGLG